MEEHNHHSCLFGSESTLGQAIAQEMESQGAHVSKLPSFFVDSQAITEFQSVFKMDKPKLSSVVIVPDVEAKDMMTEASVSEFRKLDQLDMEDVEKILKSEVADSLEICKHTIPLLEKAGGGNILIIGGLNGIKAIEAPAHFAAAKAALNGLVSSLSKEIGGKNICINTVVPGVVEGYTDNLVPQKMVDRVKRHSCLGRSASLSEISKLICWFAMHNSYVTGQALLMDGGL